MIFVDQMRSFYHIWFITLRSANRRQQLLLTEPKDYLVWFEASTAARAAATAAEAPLIAEQPLVGATALHGSGSLIGEWQREV